MSQTYKIVRLFVDCTRHRERKIKGGLTLAQARAHCRDPEASSSYCRSARMLRYTRKVGCSWWDTFVAEK